MTPISEHLNEYRRVNIKYKYFSEGYYKSKQYNQEITDKNALIEMMFSDVDENAWVPVTIKFIDYSNDNSKKTSEKTEIKISELKKGKFKTYPGYDLHEINMKRETENGEKGLWAGLTLEYYKFH